MSALFLAALSGTFGTVETLIKAGGNPDLLSMYGHSARSFVAVSARSQRFCPDKESKANFKCYQQVRDQIEKFAPLASPVAATATAPAPADSPSSAATLATAAAAAAAASELMKGVDFGGTLYYASGPFQRCGEVKQFGTRDNAPPPRCFVIIGVVPSSPAPHRGTRDSDSAVTPIFMWYYRQI